MRREIDERTLERADILMTNVWGQEELDKTAVFWEASLDRPTIARKIVDAGEVIRGEKNGRTDASQITYFKNCAFWGIGAAAIGGLIYDKLSQQGKGLVLDFNPHEFYDDTWAEGTFEVEAVKRFDKLLSHIEATLTIIRWLAGKEFSLADIGYALYMTRLNHLQLQFLWNKRPHIPDWYDRLRERRALHRGTGKWFNPNYLPLMKEKGLEIRDKVKAIVG